MHTHKNQINFFPGPCSEYALLYLGSIFKIEADLIGTEIFGSSGVSYARDIVPYKNNHLSI